jgi:hypothetical protein
MYKVGEVLIIGLAGTIHLFFEGMAVEEDQKRTQG